MTSGSIGRAAPAGRHRAFLEAVAAAREGAGRAHGGHGPDHDAMVAAFALRIAPDPRTGELAWLAAHLHSFDRRLPWADLEPAVRAAVRTACGLSAAEAEAVVEAVLEHARPNDPADRPVTVTLKDADRLANIGPSIAIRAGQHLPVLPPYETDHLGAKNPASTFREPRSVLDDIRECLVWEGWLRTPKAREIGRPYFEFLRTFIAMNRRHVEETLSTEPVADPEAEPAAFAV